MTLLCAAIAIKLFNSFTCG